MATWHSLVWSLFFLVPLVSSELRIPNRAANYVSDIAFYGINLNQTIILGQIGFGKGATPYETLIHTAVGNIIVQASGYLPGFVVGIFLPDMFGRVRVQFWGCIMMCIIYAVWAGVTNHTSTGGLMAIFTISQLILCSTVNVTTFLIPVELFPTRVRATAHGLAAASGKAGAVLTSFAFGAVVEGIGLAGTLGLFSGIMALNAAVTLLIPETKGKSLDDIESDVLYGRAQAASNASDNGESNTDSDTVKPKAIDV